MSIVRLLLISHNPQLASQLRSLLIQVTTVTYELDWRSDRDPLSGASLDWQGERQTWSTDYAICLVDREGLPNLPRDPDLLALLSHWQQELARVPLILIANDLDFGQWAILAGIEDYWHLPGLTLDTVERSLRLLSRVSQTSPCSVLQPSLTELPASSAYYQSLLEHHPYALLSLDKCGRLIFANAIARQTLELGEDYLGKSLAVVYGGQLADKWLNDHEWILRTRKPLEQIENFRDPQSQRLTIFSTLKRPLFSATGEILGTQILLWEVTDQQKLQDRLNLLQTLLLEIDHLSDFTEALNVILRRICDTTGWQYGEVWLPQWDEDHGSDVLRISKAWYCNAPELVRYYEASKTFLFLPGDGLPGRVWVSGQPEWLEDVTQAESIHYFLRRELASVLNLKGALGVPLQMNGKVIAVVVFFTRYFWVDDPSLVDMVTAIAEQLGLVLARKQSEEKRQQQKEVLEKLVENLPVMVAAFDQQGKVKWINRCLETVLGWTLADYQTQDVMAQCYPDPLVRARVIKHIETGNPHWHDVESLTKNGEKLDTTWANMSLSDNSIIGIGQDITERKQQEQAFQHQADQLKLLINALPVFIAYLNPQLRYEFVNHTYEERLLKSPQDICGQSMEFVLGHDLYQQLLPKLRQAQQGQTVNYQALIEQSATVQILVETKLIPDLDKKGELQGIFLLAIELGTDGTPQLSF